MVVSLVVGLRYISVSRWEVFLIFVKSRKLMQPFSSCVRLNYKLACLELACCIR